MQRDNMLSPIGTPPRRRYDGRIPTTSFLTPKKDTSFLSSTRLSPLKSSPRYSLSETASPRLLNNSRREQITYRSGPLLASTRFNVNLGTYTDVKSPGLASRIVQYNNEQQQETIHTHQPKYGSPGLFPVVHFFKKDLPVISPKQKRVTVKLSSPDVGLYYGTNDTITSLSDDTQINTNRDPSHPDISTRSVLDALKEISRKRINGAEEYNNTPEVKKSKRLNEYNLNEFSKRTREESPPKDVTSPPIKQPTKRMCIIDPIYASSTSSLFYIERGTKRKVIPPEANNKCEQTENKQIKLTNAETQTIEVPATKVVIEIKEKDTEKEVLVKNKEAPLNETYSIPAVSVFSEKLHEIQKKNKLAKVLGAITGEKPVLIPLEIGTIDDPKPTPVSILSPQNKAKHDKHVHFNLEKNTATDKVDTSVPTSVEISVTTTTTATTKSLASPVVATISQNIVTTAASSISSSMFNFGNNTTTTPPKIKTSQPAIGGFKFDVTPSSNSKPSSTSTTNQSSMFNLTHNSTPPKSTGATASNLPTLNFGTPSKADISTVSFGAGLNPVASSTILSNTFTVSSPNKPPISTQASVSLTTTTAVSTPSMFGSKSSQNSTFGNTTVTKASETNMFKSTTMFQSPTSTAPSTLNFVAGNKTSTSATSFGNASKTSTTSMFGNTTTTTPAFGNNGQNASPAFGSNTSSTTATSTFGNNTKITTTSQAFGNNAGNVITTPAFTGFGDAAKSQSVTTTTQSAPAFGTSAATTTGGNFGSSGFGTSSIFGTNTTTTSSFGAPVSSASIFGAAGAKATTASSTLFGTTTGFSATSTTPTFSAGSNNTSTTATTGFGGNKPASTFGSAPTPAFGVATTTSFGIPNTTAASFGGTTTNTGFGTTPGFGTVSSSSGFGGPAVTANPGFGTSVTTNAGFGTAVATTTSGFGGPTTTSNTGFGATTTMTSVFGGPATTNSGFGATTANTTFGATPANTTFGAPATTSGGFGGFSFGNTTTTGFGGQTTTNSNFGVTNTTTSANAAPAFGATPTTTTTPSFGNNTMFGTSTTTASFNFGGSSTATAASPFGTTPNTSTFGASGFGASTTSTFVAPTTTQPTFGTSQQPPAFGSTVNSTFGAKTTASMFGTTNTPAFGTAGSAPAFGAPNTSSSFGSTNNNNNNNNNAFGSTAPAFGSSSFGNTNLFGNANPGFGGGDFKTQSTGFGTTNNTAPPFGSTGQTNFNTFGANANAGNQQSGVFAFGSSNSNAPVATATSPNTKPGGVFSFGNSEAPKPAGTFNFSGNATTSFGSPTPNFGTPNFGNTTTPAFNSQYASPNTSMFSIGTGSSVKSRTQLKAKRRT